MSFSYGLSVAGCAMVAFLSFSVCAAGKQDSSSMSHTDFSIHLAADVRDLWWTEEYKALLKEKCRLGQKKKVLDVGCGAGNSTRLVAELVSDAAEIVGIDPDEEVLTIAREKTPASARISYQPGSATQLPFPDNTFDFVFCQTVMIHLPDPEKALQEMKRVLKPGGLLMMGETNNRAHLVQSNSATRALSLEERLDLIAFFNHIERGKIMDGGGDISIAAMLPSMCREQGFQTVEVRRNDRSFYAYPPYEEPDQKAAVAFYQDMAAHNYFLFSPADAKKFFLISNPDETLHKKYAAVVAKMNALYLKQIKAQTFNGTLGAEMLVIVARKP